MDPNLFVRPIEQLVLLVLDGPDQLAELFQRSGDPNLVIGLERKAAAFYLVSLFF